MHYLSLCAIFKNEAPYLEEWLRFYDLIGIEHFYLFDNESTDGSLEVLEPWRNAGRVTLYPWPGRAMQIPAYRHCLWTHAFDSVWIAFVDLDEFLFSPAQSDLRVFLKDFEGEAGVVANWLMFGTAGHQHPPGGLATLNFTRRCDVNLCTFEGPLLKEPGLDPREAASYHKICAHVKSIVRTGDATDTGLSSHDFRYRDGRKPVNALGQPILGPYSDDLSAIQLLRVNHYFSRSRDEFEKKLQRGRSDTGTRYHADELNQRNLLFEQVEDRDIFPLARRVEANMSGEVRNIPNLR